VRPEDVRIAELEAEVVYLRRRLEERSIDYARGSLGCLQPRAASIRSNRKASTAKAARSVGASRGIPRKIDWTRTDSSKWHFKEVRYNGGYTWNPNKKPEFETCRGGIMEGVRKLQANPGIYRGIWYQTNMVHFPEDQQQYKLVKRTGSGFGVQELRDGPFTYIEARYLHLQQPGSIIVDKYTDQLSYQGKRLAKPRSPGRGEGCADIPNLKIIGDVDPSDVAQGGVGDCWLLSAISSLAEYDGAIAHLFRKTRDIASMPRNSTNMYTVTLYDLRTWTPVDIEIDERLCYTSDDSGLLGAGITVDGELWVSYLEKAVAIHCGGWDKIDGGSCAHGWRLLTGCKEQYTFRKNKTSGFFECLGSRHPSTGQWERFENSPHDSSNTLWLVPWPEVGGGDTESHKVNEERMFERMCAWDDSNYIMGCGTKPGSDSHGTDGIVDGHAYSILECINNAGGTDFDMIKLRNPWGQGEFQTGKWDDDGPGWLQYPQVREACKPVAADDGVFWMDSGEFFKYFKEIHLCAYNMSEFRR